MKNIYLDKCLISMHAYRDHPNRVALILNVIGLGTPILEAPDVYGRKEIHTVLTDTGVMVIRHKTTGAILTLWIASPSQVFSLYMQVEGKPNPHMMIIAGYYFNTAEYQRASKKAR